MRHQSDKDVVNAFVNHLRNYGHPDLVIDSYPDQKNRNSCDIDATAFPFAIEHTSLDTIEHQRRYQNCFNKLATPLRDALDGTIPFNLNLVLNCNSVKSVHGLDRLREAFEVWVRDDSPSLPEGRTVVRSAKGIPFEFEVEKRTNCPPGLVVTRLVPTDRTLEDRVSDAIQRKAGKLQHYHADYATVLLIENRDRILMNKEKMLRAIHKVCPDGPPTGVDQIWYADTSNSSQTWFIHVTPYLKPANHSMFG